MPAGSKGTGNQSSWPPSTIPPNETDDQRRTRLSEESEARRVSELIDRQIEQEKETKTRHLAVKILLLGQAESGKSTVLKNFQLHFAPKAFEQEAAMWSPIIHFNLVRSVNFIVGFINTVDQSRPPSSDSHHHRRSSSSSTISSDIRKICTRLAPLRQVEEHLSRFISGKTSPRHASLDTDPSSSQFIPATGAETTSSLGWKRVFTLSSRGLVAPTNSREDLQNRRILAALGEDIASLWKHPFVQQTLLSAEIALEEQPGFFLDQAVRITKEDYRPRAEDVLKARVATVGPEEHQIVAESHLKETCKRWTIYDVGGTRSQRPAWAQFFDDVNIIIFLAPMSGFNQVLAEDETVNRLTDSLRLWQMICSNKILANVEFVLFLNKLDILDSKIKSGISFASFVTSYGNRPNETKQVAKYLLEVFVSLHQQCSPRRRKVHPHLTCAVDTRATATVISRIHDVVLVSHLTQTNIL